MYVQELMNYVSASVRYPIYPNSFPTSAKDDSIMVKLTGGGSADKYTLGIRESSVQFLVKAKHPKQAEETANKIFKLLHGVRHREIGSTFIYSCTCNQSDPIFIGVDENQRQIYSLNFTCVTGVQPN